MQLTRRRRSSRGCQQGFRECRVLIEKKGEQANKHDLLNKLGKPAVKRSGIDRQLDYSNADLDTS